MSRDNMDSAKDRFACAKARVNLLLGPGAATEILALIDAALEMDRINEEQEEQEAHENGLDAIYGGSCGGGL